MDLSVRLLGCGRGFLRERRASMSRSLSSASISLLTSGESQERWRISSMPMKRTGSRANRSLS